MKRLTLLIIILLGTCIGSNAQPTTDENPTTSNLVVIWSSGDPEVAEKVCFMYVKNAKKQGWFDRVVLIVWGPSVKLLAENEDLQADIVRMHEMGITIEASITSANMYGVNQILDDLNIEIKPMGVPLTDYLKEGWSILSF